MDRSQLLYLSVGVGITCFFAILAILIAGRKPVYRKKGQLLLVNEQRFLTAALQALPMDTLMTFKVRLSHIVGSKSATSGKSLDDELSPYTLDFVLIDRNTSEVKLCIEMLMEGRDRGGNIMIERSLRRAGVPHLKLPLVRFYDPVRLRQLFVTAIRGETPV